MTNLFNSVRMTHNKLIPVYNVILLPIRDRSMVGS